MVSSEPLATQWLSGETASEVTVPVCPFAAGSQGLSSRRWAPVSGFIGVLSSFGGGTAGFELCTLAGGATKSDELELD